MEEKLTEEQSQAEKLILEWFLNNSNQVFVLAGYAGTGKTFLINHVVKVLGLKSGKEAVFITPTGKAASILMQAGTPASTIHSLIYTRDEDDFQVDENGEILSRPDLKFIKREKIGEAIRLIIVDEASMVSEEVLQDIISYKVKCLFCGDNAQLPPVSGNTNLLDTPDFQLTEIVRQEKDNPIIQLAAMARKGENIPYGNYSDTVAVLSKKDLVGEQRKRILCKADQIIVGRNKTRAEINREMRLYQGISTDSYLPCEGEKVICTLNNWERFIDENREFNLVNGIIGYAYNIQEKSDYLATMDFRAEFLKNKIECVPFDGAIFTIGSYVHGYGDLAIKLLNGRVVHESNFKALHKFKAVGQEVISRFEFAYAVTCHKAQGSEFDFVIVFDESWAFGEEKNKWLYTAITRAKKKLIILR